MTVRGWFNPGGYARGGYVLDEAVGFGLMGVFIDQSSDRSEP